MKYPSNEDQNNHQKENLDIAEQKKPSTEEPQNANIDEAQLKDHPVSASNYPTPSSTIDNNVKREEPNIPLDILIGLGITMIEYALIILSLFLHFGIAIVGTIASVILAVAIFTSIKLIRKNHKLAGILVLALISPIVLFMLLVGACGLMFNL